MKKIIPNALFILFIFVFIVSEDVSAYSEENYINSENVEIKYDLYKELCTIYSEGYIEFITQDKFDLIKDNRLSDIDVIEVNDFPLISTLSSSHTTTYKRLKIIKNGMLITLQLTWLNIPTVRSYDVMGIQWSSSFDPDWNSYSGKQTSNVGTTNYTAAKSPGYFKEYSHAITLAMNLYDSATSLTNYLEITGTCSGTININGSYQHATKDISLANLNNNYGLNANGLGGMFDFWGAASGVYDGMAGVNTSFTCS